MKDIRSRPVLLIAALAASIAASAPAAGSGAGLGQEPVLNVTLPSRRAPPSSAPLEPPPLPAQAESLAPMTLTVVSTSQTPDGHTQTTRQTVIRTSDRVLVTSNGTESEWLFERNAVDTRRVSGYLIDHKTRRILIHHESDLRTSQRLRGWLDVLTLRFAPDSLNTLRATSEGTTAGGTSFTKYLGDDRADRGIAEVWWSDSLLLPLRLTVRNGKFTTTSTIESFDGRVAHAKLGPPSTRFPTYRVSDVSDAREYGHH